MDLMEKDLLEMRTSSVDLNMTYLDYIAKHLQIFYIYLFKI